MKNKRLKKARINKNLTQLELAKMVGSKDKQSVSNWENGHSKPTLETALALAIILEKDVEFLFGHKVQVTHTSGEVI